VEEMDANEFKQAGVGELTSQETAKLKKQEVFEGEKL
jgi:hypothetical protein